jgi:starch phosphorylase
MKRTNEPVVAYFSLEYAIADDLPIYAGGLGILAADLVLEAGLEDKELYAIGMAYHQAFAGDDLDQRPVTERLTANYFELLRDDAGERLLTEVQVADRTVKLQAWVKRWGRTQLILLDSRVDGNDERDQAICDHLYPSDPQLALAQEQCLGFGGVALLAALGVAPDVFHLNEGHAAMAGLAVALRYLKAHPSLNFEEAAAAVKHSLVATKHTILPGAGLFLKWADVERQLGPTITKNGATIEDLKGKAGRPSGDYSATKLLLSLAGLVSGVSKLHVAAERRDHSDSRLIPITNGVSRWRWTTTAWTSDPLSLDDEKIWAIHSECRRELLDHVSQQTGDVLSPDNLTVVWARRMTAYKRPALLVNDLVRLAALIHDAKHPVQFIVAGQANPSDDEGIAIMQRVIETARRPDLAHGFAYLPRYDTVGAKSLVRGADLWLNTPIKGFEACGTSGMKASLNGVLQFSTSDGWIDEVDITKIGWELPARPEQAIYNILEDKIAPLFYERREGIPHGWVQLMRANMKLSTKQFTASRMLAEYYEKLYLPATALVA